MKKLKTELDTIYASALIGYWKRGSMTHPVYDLPRFFAALLDHLAEVNLNGCCEVPEGSTVHDHLFTQVVDIYYFNFESAYYENCAVFAEYKNGQFMLVSHDKFLEDEFTVSPDV